MKKFWIRTVNLILIVGIIVGYNQIILYRQKTEEVNSLKAELTDSKTMLKNEENKLTYVDNNANETSSGNYASVYKDGKYTGQGTGYGGTIQVQVTINQGEIADIDVLSVTKEDKAYFDMAVKIIDVIKENQSTDVDTVSGATFSSTGILNGVKQALEKAR